MCCREQSVNCWNGHVRCQPRAAYGHVGTQERLNKTTTGQQRSTLKSRSRRLARTSNLKSFEGLGSTLFLKTNVLHSSDFAVVAGPGWTKYAALEHSAKSRGPTDCSATQITLGTCEGNKNAKEARAKGAQDTQSRPEYTTSPAALARDPRKWSHGRRRRRSGSTGQCARATRKVGVETVATENGPSKERSHWLESTTLTSRLLSVKGDPYPKTRNTPLDKAKPHTRAGHRAMQGTAQAREKNQTK